jgi:hypothetical protein
MTLFEEIIDATVIYSYVSVGRQTTAMGRPGAPLQLALPADGDQGGLERDQGGVETS